MPLSQYMARVDTYDAASDALRVAAPLIVAAELERQARDLGEQAEAFGLPRMGTPASGMVTVLSELAEELRGRAAELRGGEPHG